MQRNRKLHRGYIYSVKNRTIPRRNLKKYTQAPLTLVDRPSSATPHLLHDYYMTIAAQLLNLSETAIAPVQLRIYYITIVPQLLNLFQGAIAPVQASSAFRFKALFIKSSVLNCFQLIDKKANAADKYYEERTKNIE
jgi:hypothetical protein